MKRRSFLKFLGAGAAVLAVPRELMAKPKPRLGHSHARIPISKRSWLGGGIMKKYRAWEVTGGNTLRYSTIQLPEGGSFLGVDGRRWTVRKGVLERDLR